MNSEIIDTKDLAKICSMRLDVFIKILYTQSILRNDPPMLLEKFRSMYREHLYVWNNFREYDINKNLIKSTFEDFDNVFNETILSIKLNDFNKEISYVYIRSINGIPSLVNGSHRVAAALVLKKSVNVIYNNFGVIGASWNGTFKKLNLSSTIASLASIEAVRFLKDACTIIIAFPKSNLNEDYFINELLKFEGKTLFFKKIKLTDQGGFNLIKNLYYGESWIGNISNNFIGAKSKFNYCFDSDKLKECLIFVTTFKEPKNIILAKKNIREYFNHGNHTMHSTDNFEESFRVASTLLHDNSLCFLNKNLNNSIGQNCLDKFLSKFKEILNDQNRDPADFCIVGSAVLTAYGLRECKDLDYIQIGESLKDTNIHCIESHLPLHINWYSKFGISEIIYDPSLYFYYRGIKFASLEVIKDAKIIKSESKDLIDINLIDEYLKNN